MLQTPATVLRLRPRLGERLWLAFGGAVLIASTLGLAALAIVGFLSSPVLGAVLGPLAVFIGLMAWLVLREVRASWSTRVSIDASTVRLTLPAVRGYAAQAALDSWIPLASIAAVERREEAFRSLGTTTIQRAYALLLQDGSRVTLGADRPMKAEFFLGAAVAIAAHAKAPLHDRGLVDGKAGPILAVGNRAPEWTAPGLPEPLARKRRNAAAMTYTLIGAVFVAIMVLRLALHLI